MRAEKYPTLVCSAQALTQQASAPAQLLLCMFSTFPVHGDAYLTFDPGYVFPIFFLSILSKNIVFLEQNGDLKA